MSLIPSCKKWRQWSSSKKVQYLVAVIGIVGPFVGVGYFIISKYIEMRRNEIPVYELEVVEDTIYESAKLDSLQFSNAGIVNAPSQIAITTSPQPAKGLRFKHLNTTFESNLPLEQFIVTNNNESPALITEIWVTVESFEPFLGSPETIEILPSISYQFELKRTLGTYHATLPHALNIPIRDSKSILILFYTELFREYAPPTSLGKFRFTVWLQTEDPNLASTPASMSY